MEIFTFLFLVLFFSFFLGKLLEYLKFPSLLGPLLVGLIFSFFGENLGLNIETSLLLLSELALIMLLFYVGLDMKLSDLRKYSYEVFVFGIGGVLITAFLILVMLSTLTNFGFVELLLVSIILSLSSESVLVIILEKHNLIRKKLGEILIGSALISNLIGFLLVIVISTFRTFETVSIHTFFPLIFFLIVLLIGFLCKNYLSNAIDKILIRKDVFKSSSLITYSFLFLFLFALFAQISGLDLALGAALAGIVLNFSLHRGGPKGAFEELKIDHFVKNITFGFLAYFFFFWIGYSVDSSIFFTQTFLSIKLAFFAFIIKLMVCALLDRLLFSKDKEGKKIGVALSSKGGFDLFLAALAFETGLISSVMFSSLVMVTVILAFVSPLIFGILMKSEN